MPFASSIIPWKLLTIQRNPYARIRRIGDRQLLSRAPIPNRFNAAVIGADRRRADSALPNLRWIVLFGVCGAFSFISFFILLLLLFRGFSSTEIEANDNQRNIFQRCQCFVVHIDHGGSRKTEHENQRNNGASWPCVAF